MRLLLPVLILALLITGVPASGQQAEARISFEFTQTPFRKAVEKVAQLGGLKCRVLDGVPDTPVSMRTQSVAPGTALRLLVRQAAAGGLTLTRTEDGYVVGIEAVDSPHRTEVPRLFPDPRLQHRVTARFERTPLRLAVKRLFEKAGTTCEVGARVPSVLLTLALEDETCWDGLLRVFDLARKEVPALRLTRQRGVYLLDLEPRDPPAPQLLETLRRRRITLAPTSLPLRAALGKIFMGSGLQFSVAPNVPDLEVSLDLRDATLEAALQALIRAAKAPGLTLSYSGDVVILEVRSRDAVDGK